MTKRFYLYAGTLGLALVAMLASACDEETDGSAGSGAASSTAAATTGAAGAGGEGGATPCLQCGDFIGSLAVASPEDLCGYQSGDFMMELMCDASSSCELFKEAFACACTMSCTAECGDNACVGEAPSLDCHNCSNTVCMQEFAACANDD